MTKKAHNMTEQEITQFFKTLYGICRNNNHVYSVKQVIIELGFDCNQVTQWAGQKDLWRDLLNECRGNCDSNAEKAGMCWGLPSKIALKYMYENRYGFKYYGNSNELEELMFL